MTDKNAPVHAPETIEGWFALHQVFRDTDAKSRGVPPRRANSYPDGWSGTVQLIGSRGHVMMIHFYPTLEGIADAQRKTSETDNHELIYSFLSVTEAGLYHITAQLASDAERRGGEVSAKYAEFGQFFVGKFLAVL